MSLLQKADEQECDIVTQSFQVANQVKGRKQIEADSTKCCSREKDWYFKSVMSYQSQCAGEDEDETSTVWSGMMNCNTRLAEYITTRNKHLNR